MKVAVYIASLLTLMATAVVATPVAVPGAEADLAPRNCDVCRVSESSLCNFLRSRSVSPYETQDCPNYGFYCGCTCPA